MNWLFGSMMGFALLMLVSLIVTMLALDHNRVQLSKRPQVYEVMAVKMKGDCITIEEGWEPFGVSPTANVIYVKRRKADAPDN